MADSSAASQARLTMRRHLFDEHRDVKRQTERTSRRSRQIRCSSPGSRGPGGTAPHHPPAQFGQACIQESSLLYPTPQQRPAQV